VRDGKEERKGVRTFQARKLISSIRVVVTISFPPNTPQVTAFTSPVAIFVLNSPFAFPAINLTSPSSASPCSLRFSSSSLLLLSSSSSSDWVKKNSTKAFW
jgi:hypothetical protein